MLSKINDYDSKMQQLADEIEATTANYALEQQQFEQLKVYMMKFQCQLVLFM